MKGENRMEYIKVTIDNLEQEHICCAISTNKDVQVISKKAWLGERFDEGLVFLNGREEPFSFNGEMYTISGTGKQFYGQFIFQGGNHLAHGRLCIAKQLSGLGETS